jgi:hypothetical protein
MPGALVEYARFVEVQQRRSRIAAELEPPAEALIAGAARTAVDECDECIDDCIHDGQPVTSADERARRGPIDVC